MALLLLLLLLFSPVACQHSQIAALLQDALTPYHTQLNQSLANVALLEKDVSPRIFKVHIESPCTKYEASEKCLDQSCAVYELTRKQLQPLAAQLESGVFSAEGQSETSPTLDDSHQEGYYYDLMHTQEGNTNYNGLLVWQYLYQKVETSPSAYHLLRAMHHSVNSHIAHRYHADGSSSLEQYATRVYKHNRAQFTTNIKTMLDIHQVIGVALSQIRALPPLEVHRASLAVLHQMDLPANLSVHNMVHVSSIETPLLGEMYQLVNCVECLKCKIYGKMQITGLASAVLAVKDPKQTALLTRNQVTAILMTYLQMGRSLRVFRDSLVPLEAMVARQRKVQYVLLGLLALAMLAVARHHYNKIRVSQGYLRLPDSKHS